MRTSAEVEADVEASRNDLDRNVEALKQKMTPGQLFDETARMMGGTGQQVAAKFAEQAKANPMPLAVMGLGLAWLMVSNNRSGGGGGGAQRSYAGGESRSFADGGSADGFGAQASDAVDGLKDKAQAIGDKAQGLFASVKDKIADARDSASQSGRSATSGLGSAAGAVRDTAGEAAQRVQQSVARSLDAEPLLLAGLGLIVGAAIGAAFPATDAENRVLGKAHDKIVDKGKDLAQTGLQKAGAVAQATYGAVKSELKEGDASRDPADRIAEAARSGVQAARQEAQGPAH